jgi:hypothetical protein
MIRIFGDFNNRDEENRVRLGTEKTNEDLATLADKLREGLTVLVYDGDYEAEGVLEFVDGLWRARIRWDTGRDTPSRS